MNVTCVVMKKIQLYLRVKVGTGVCTGVVAVDVVSNGVLCVEVSCGVEYEDPVEKVLDGVDNVPVEDTCAVVDTNKVVCGGVLPVYLVVVPVTKERVLILYTQVEKHFYSNVFRSNIPGS